MKNDPLDDEALEYSDNARHGSASDDYLGFDVYPGTARAISFTVYGKDGVLGRTELWADEALDLAALLQEKVDEYHELVRLWHATGLPIAALHAVSRTMH